MTVREGDGYGERNRVGRKMLTYDTVGEPRVKQFSLDAAGERRIKRFTMFAINADE